MTLTATAFAGSRFTGWSGDCAGAAATCTVTVDAARTVTASFVATATVQVIRAGGGGGTVTSSPGGIDCGATCVRAWELGTVVTLSATPAPGSTFGGWEGPCTGTQPTCRFTLGTDVAVTATFGVASEPGGGGGGGGCATLPGARPDLALLALAILVWIRRPPGSRSRD